MVPEVEGIVVSCDLSGTVEEILHDGDGLAEFFPVGAKWFEAILSDNGAKTDRFRSLVASHGVALNYEFNVRWHGDPATYRFGGMKVDERLIIFASRTHNGLTSLIDQFTTIGNEQTNIIRARTKELGEIRAAVEQEYEQFDEISRLNNELVNLNRTVAKKNRELAGLNKEKDRFIGMAAHDLRNPLANVLLLAQFIEQEFPDDESTVQRYAEQIRRVCGSMLSMVENLLDVSTIESGEIRLERSYVALDDLIRRSLSLNVPLAGSRQIDLVGEPTLQDVVVAVDENKILQVLNNLFANAVKYSERGSTVCLSVDVGDADVSVSIIDQGVGIPENEMGRLFQPYGTTSNKPLDGRKSTGLGLYIARRIVEAHGGRIWIERTDERGSEFSFTLPRHES